MQLQHEGNSHTRGNSWKRTDQDGTGKDKGGERVEDTNKSQRCREFSQICQLLLTIHSQLQSYGETFERTQRQEGMEMGRRASKGI